LSAGLLRQATYTTTRLGVYQFLEDSYKEKNGSLPGFMWKLLFGMTSGGIGAIIGTPAEITLVRMTADGRLPPAERRNYKHAFDALGRIARDEGVLTLWRGWQPTVIRAMVLNAAQLAVYSQAKQSLISTGTMKDGTPAHFVASIISGFMSTVVSIPIDITKTRLQNMKNNEYSGTADVLMKVVRNEGFFALWKGFTPYFLRLGPHTIITFLLMERLNAWTKR
jgi:solute carrier family 25 oxoglutarate transporter 11